MGSTAVAREPATDGETPAVREAQRKGKRTRQRDNAKWFWIFTGPFVLGLLIFSYIPIVWSVILSFGEAKNTVNPTQWVGFDNYINLLKSASFRDSLLTFVVFAVFIVPLTYALSLGLAILVNQVRFMRAFFRSAFFLPAACSYVVAALIWKQTIFNGLPTGLANRVVTFFGGESQAWLATTQPPLYWIVLITVRLWLQVGFYMILLLAALQKIAPDLYEAAYVDGANPGWQTFRYITLPQIRAASISVIVLLTINAFQAFDEFWNVLSSSKGYPPYAQPPLVYLYQVGLGTGQDFGRGGAGGVILTVVILIFTLLQTRLLGLGKRAGREG